MTDEPEFTRRYLNLADERLGARVYYATDDFFAPKERMISSSKPVFIPDKYDENGKWISLIENISISAVFNNTLCKNIY